MKKITGIILISLFLITSLVACSNNNESENNNELLLVDDSLKVDVIGKENPHEIEIKTTETTPIETKDVENIETEDINNDLLTTGMQNKITSKKELSVEEKNSILKIVDEFVVTDKETLKELVLIIDENIASFELRERDLLIRKYVLSLYDLMNNLNSVLSVIGYDLETVVSEYKINVNDKNSIQSIPDKYGTVKGFLLEVKDKGFFINSLNNNTSFYLDLDLGNVLEKYKDYISPSMNEYLNFNNYEMHNTMTLSETNTYNLEELANRINTLSLGLEVDKNNNYVMVDKYTSSLKYYYNLLLGLSHSQFVDNNNMFNGDILNMYKTLQTKYKDTTLGSVLEKTILVIEASENVYDENIKLMIDEYLNSLIYTQEIQDTLNNNTYNKYVILNTNENDEEIINENNKSE